MGQKSAPRVDDDCRRKQHHAYPKRFSRFSITAVTGPMSPAGFAAREWERSVNRDSFEPFPGRHPQRASNRPPNETPALHAADGRRRYVARAPARHFVTVATKPLTRYWDRSSPSRPDVLTNPPARNIRRFAAPSRPKQSIDRSGEPGSTVQKGGTGEGEHRTRWCVAQS